MKTLKAVFFSFLFISFATASIAQSKTEKIKVAGECGMCKAKIEKAAKGAGASYALWDVDAKVLTVKYNSNATNTTKIENAVAGVGYDTQHAKATTEAYDRLHECCKYDRKASEQNAAVCCSNEKCIASASTQDGKCEKDMSCCKQADNSTKNCCKKA